MCVGRVPPKGSNIRHTITHATRHKPQMDTTLPSVWKMAKRMMTAVPSRVTNHVPVDSGCNALITHVSKTPKLLPTIITALQEGARTKMMQFANQPCVPVLDPMASMTAGLEMENHSHAVVATAQK